jgi:hypothetical protein
MGIFMSIFSGDAVGAAGVSPGMFIPGMCVCGDALGLAAGMGIFMSIFCGGA